MTVLKLYEICLSGLFKNSFVNPNSFNELPVSCLRDILPYLTPYELERLDLIYRKRSIPINDLWRRHFELIWSLSRDDKDSYESIFDIPYQRLYFEYLFHDTQILQLGIYTHISQINQSKSILNLSFLEQMKYNLTRDSIIYCSKTRLAAENQNLIILWNHQWNKYIKRFILVPHIWNLTKIDPLLIECFTENITDIVLSGYPTENDYHGMKFILDILTRGHIRNMILKFPSYCLMNILLPLFIYPRSYALSYLSTRKENDSRESNLFIQNLILPIRKRKLCLHVEIHSKEEHGNLNRVLSTNHQLNEEEEDDSSTHAVISDSNHSFDLLSNSSNTYSSTLAMRNNLSQLPSESFFQTDLRAIESSHLLSAPENNRSTSEPYQRLLPYLNRSRTVHQHSTLASVLTPARHLSTSEQSVPSVNRITEPLSSSDSNLFRRHTTTTATISSAPGNTFSIKKAEHEINEEKFVILHLTPENQLNSLTNLSIYYVSSFETIEMIAIALLGKIESRFQCKRQNFPSKGMNQIQHLTLVNFASYSSQLETSLITLCLRSQLQSLHLTSISLIHGAIGFLLHLFRNKNDRKNLDMNLKRLKLDSIKIFALLTDQIHLSDVEQAEFMRNSSLEQFSWRERHMQYIHMRLLYKLLPNMMSKLHRLELFSILECVVFDQFPWCQTFLHHISDVRLRNFRIRSINLTRFFFALNTQCVLTVFHFERVGLTWNNDQQSMIIDQAFTSLILHATHLNELSLAYNNLNSHFIQWLCQMLLWNDRNIERKKTSWWSIVILNLTFNLISSEAIRRLIDALKEYKDRWNIRQSPIRRIDILGNALEIREISDLKKQFNTIGCDLISYILP